MCLLFENANTKSLDKKWCATSMLPICTPLQVPSLKTKRPYAKIVPMGSQSTGPIHPNIENREYRLVRPKFV